MGKIIIYDDEPKIVQQLKSGIRKVGLTPNVFTDLKALRKYIYSEENWDDMQALIFDLAQAFEAESGDHNYAIIEDIIHCYKNRRVPILIHSAFAEQVESLQDLPGIFLYKKGATAIRRIRDDLHTMKESGFLDLFCEGSLLNDEVRVLQERLGIDQDVIKSLLHDEYVDLFRNHETIIEDLREIVANNERPVKVCYERFLKPAVDKIIG